MNQNTRPSIARIAFEVPYEVRRAIRERAASHDRSISAELREIVLDVLGLSGESVGEAE